MSHAGVCWALGLVAAVVVAGEKPARAVESGPESVIDVGGAFTLRFQPPLMQAVFLQDTSGSTIGAGSIVGTSVSWRFRDLFEAEAGGTLMANICTAGTLGSLRMGISPSVVNPHPDGTHWNVRIPLLASGHLVSISRRNCADADQSSGTLLTLASGIDATHWGDDFAHGFNLRLLAGVDPHGLGEVTLTLGLAFR